MLNLIDLIVVVIIFTFAFIGMRKGFVISVFKVLSFFGSLYLSVKLYPIIRDFLVKTSLYNYLSNAAFKGLVSQKENIITAFDSNTKQIAADQVINNLKVPDAVKQLILGNISEPSKLFDINKVFGIIGDELAMMAISIIAFFALFFIIRIIFGFMKILLKSICKLPVFKQLDKLGGFSLGALEGLFSIYIIFALFTLFNSSPLITKVNEVIISSVIAKFLYENNLIINMLFSK